jgi:CRISPR/Cas system CSM-associated protein Csm3 (group 7 of RAMP superfamily)
MSAKIERIITGILKLKAPLHVGIGKANEPTDAPIRRSGDGKIFIPGRAIGGALRNTATLLAPRFTGEPCDGIRKEWTPQKICGCPVCQLFGEFFPGVVDLEKEAIGEEEGGFASKLWIEDAFVVNESTQPEAVHSPPPITTHIRDGVGISRSARAAHYGAKFDHETVPAETAFRLCMRWVDTDEDSTALRGEILAAALAEWQAGRGRIGSNASRGMGGFILEPQSIQVYEKKLDTAEKLFQYLLADQHENLGSEGWLTPLSNWLDSAMAEARKNICEVALMKKGGKDSHDYSQDVTRSFANVTMTLNLMGPFLSNEPLVAGLSGFDHAPTVDQVFREKDSNFRAGKPIITGASLRGAIRSHAEKIARTLAMLKIKARMGDDFGIMRGEFLKKCPACHPLASNEKDSLPLENCDSRWRKKEKDNIKEIAADKLCLSCQLFGSARFGSRLIVDDASWAAAADPDGQSWKAQDFLAIDRFTGGSLEGAKFDAAPLVEPKLTFSMTLYNPRAWELGWLALTLRDLKEGEMTIGFGAAKGYGRVTCENISWKIGYLKPDDFPVDLKLKHSELLPEKNSNTSGLYKILSGKLDGLDKKWQQEAKSWVNAFHDKLANPSYDGADFQKDTFLGDSDELYKLYGLPQNR